MELHINKFIYSLALLAQLTIVKASFSFKITPIYFQKKKKVHKLCNAFEGGQKGGKLNLFS